MHMYGPTAIEAAHDAMLPAVFYARLSSEVGSAAYDFEDGEPGAPDIFNTELTSPGYAPVAVTKATDVVLDGGRILVTGRIVFAEPTTDEWTPPAVVWFTRTDAPVTDANDLLFVGVFDSSPDTVPPGSTVVFEPGSIAAGVARTYVYGLQAPITGDEG